MTIHPQAIIDKLNLEPLAGEGGYFRQVFRGESRRLPAEIYGIASSSERLSFTSIFYLLTPGSFSALHRIKGDEIFHFYGGDPVEMVQISEDGLLKRLELGADFMNGYLPQVCVPHGVWQGMRLLSGGQWALLGATSVPGFEYEDFELARRDDLLSRFPDHSEDISRLTRVPGDCVHPK